jgi:ribose transport system substrate-binding protein
MQIMKRLSLLLLALGAAAFIQGCDQSKSTSSTPRKKLRVGFVANNVNDYWSLVRLGCDLAVRQSGDAELIFRTPSQRTAAAQQEVITQMLADGLDGIAISPVDAEKETAFLNSIPTNVLLVCADSDANKSRRLCYIGTDNLAAGKQAAELLKAALPQGGKIVVLLGYPTAQNVKERVEGIKAGLAGSNIELVDILADESKATVAQKNAGDALTKYPDLVGLAGVNSYTGPAILQAVRSAHKSGQVKIVCFDEDSDALAGIVSGDIYGTVVQKPVWIGHHSISSMVNYLRGQKQELASGKILVPTRVVTKTNVVDFQLEQKTMTGPSPAYH